MDATADTTSPDESGLKRSITGRLLFFYVLGDVLGSGIYVLVGLVAAAVGGAFWLAFAVGVTIATITGLAYAELVTKYPQAAGAALYINKAFGNRFVTFVVTICMLSASFAAAGSLAAGFASYFNELWSLPPALLVGLLFIIALALINYIGITESVVLNMLMTFVEIAGLIIIMIIGVWYVAEGQADFGVLTEFDTSGSPALALLAGVAFAFFAMTGFENAANVAEESVDPSRTFPRALIGGMATAGVIYVLVAGTAALVVPMATLGGSSTPLLEVVKEGVLPVPVGFMTILFTIIAMIAITNTTLVALVTESRILYGMGREDVVPGIFSRLHRVRQSPWVALIFCVIVIGSLLGLGTLALSLGSDTDIVERLSLVTVVFTLVIYGLVILAAFKLRGQEERPDVFHAPSALLVVGLLGNAAILIFTVYDDPSSLIWCAGLLVLGLALYVAERLTRKA